MNRYHENNLYPGEGRGPSPAFSLDAPAGDGLLPAQEYGL